MLTDNPLPGLEEIAEHTRQTRERLAQERRLKMSVEEFLTVCEKRGWHFTITWVQKRLREI